MTLVPRLTSITAAVLLLAWAPISSPARKKEKVRSPLELKISGPAFVRDGQKLKFKAVLTNRSMSPVVLAPPNSHLGFGLTWKITDPEGRELKPPQMIICPVTGIEPGAKFRLEDDDVRILQPGEKIEYEDQDIRNSYAFPESGQYEVVAYYFFASPQSQLSADGNTIEAKAFLNQSVSFDLSFLSPQKGDALRHAVDLGVSSNRWSMQLVK